MMFLKIVQPFFCEQDCPAFLYTIITSIKILDFSVYFTHLIPPETHKIMFTKPVDILTLLCV
jgi:hypothetical protein